MIDFISYFHSVFLESLQSLFDVEWQEKGWGGNDNLSKYVGFDEIIMGFMDACEVVLANPKRYRLSPKQQVRIKKLFQILDEYNSSDNRPDDEQDIIQDPKWHEIREYAKLVYEELIKE